MGTEVTLDKDSNIASLTCISLRAFISVDEDFLTEDIAWKTE